MACILIIDDDQIMRAILRSILTKADYRVVEAQTTEEGLRIFDQEAPDLVVTDLFVPETGGMEVIRRLKEANPGVKIVAISGVDLRGSLDTLALAREYGALRTFQKPISPEGFVAAVQELMEGE